MEQQKIMKGCTFKQVEGEFSLAEQNFCTSHMSKEEIVKLGVNLQFIIGITKWKMSTSSNHEPIDCHLRAL